MSETRLTLMEAVARGRTVTGRYNGEIMRLAPHLIYERHGDLFVGAGVRQAGLHVGYHFLVQDDALNAVAVPGGGLRRRQLF